MVPAICFGLVVGPRFVSVLFLIYINFVSIFVLTYLFDAFGGKAGRIGALLPEIITVIMFVSVLLHLSRSKCLYLSRKYIFLFLAYLIVIAAGDIINGVQPGAVFAGLRGYMRFVPLLLLPAVIEITGSQIQSHLKLISAFAMIQLPIALYQRYVQYSHLGTGDVVTGTLGLSYTLSIFLVGVVAVLLGFYLKQGLRLRWFLLLVVMVSYPAMINETQALPLLLLPAFAIPIVVYAAQSKQRRRVSYVVGLFLVFMIGIFVVHGLETRRSTTLMEVYISGKFLGGLYKGLDKEEAGTTEQVGRIDSVRYAYGELSRDITTLVLGLGVGSVTKSFSSILVAKYSELEHLGPQRNAIGYIFWETGLLGVAIILIGLWFIFKDVLVLSREQGVKGGLALGWLGVTGLYGVSLLYANIINYNAIFLTYWYFTGYLLSVKVRATTQPDKRYGRHCEEEKSKIAELAITGR